MGDGDTSPDPRGAEVLPPLHRLEQHGRGLVVELEQPDQLFEDLVLLCRLQGE